MYMNSLFKFSLVIAERSAISLLLVYTHRSPEFTLFRLSLQNGHDCDLARLNDVDRKFIKIVHIRKLVLILCYKYIPP